jgi:hypothetical protein
MIGLTSLGLEFVEMEELHPYLRQVCPVNYADNFDYAERIRALAAGYGDSIGVIEVETRLKRERFPIHKPYKNSAAVGGTKRASTSTLYDIETFTSKELGWYGWIGKSNFAGEITDDTVAGARFRVKNIQIGDSRLIEDLAEELTPAGTERRLQRWAVGEIFVTNTQVVPNARRDGFEDNQAWREIRRDIKDKVVKRVIKLIRSASDARTHLKKSTNAYPELFGKANASTLTAAEKTKLTALIKRQIDLLGSEKVLAGADPKEVSSLLSSYKELQEKLAKRTTVDPQPTEPEPPPEPEEEESTDAETDDNADAGRTSGEDEAERTEDRRKPSSLEIILEVLTQELGQIEAERLMKIIRTRLAE